MQRILAFNVVSFLAYVTYTYTYINIAIRLQEHFDSNLITW